MKNKPTPGTKVRLTGEFLRNTGQQVGGEGLSRWIVQECNCGMCGLGRFIATNEKNYDESGQRHIAFSNLERC